MGSRHYCLTSFSVEVFNSELIKRLNVERPKNLRYMVFQIEECPSTGTLHAQGYIELNATMRPAGVTKMFNSDPKLRLFARNGTREQARHYAMCPGVPCPCKNAEKKRVKGGPYEYGVWITGQGSRSDLSAAIETLELGATMEQLQISHPATYVRCERGLRNLQNTIIPARDFQTELHVIYGGTGSGKISACISKLKPGSYFFLNWTDHQHIWFDGYEPTAHENIIIKNYDGWMPYQFLLTLCDAIPMQVPIRYGSTVFRAKRIYITSHDTPLVWYLPANFAPKGNRVKTIDPLALMRRITTLTYHRGTWPLVTITDYTKELKEFMRSLINRPPNIDGTPHIMPSYDTSETYALFPKFLREN